MGTRGTLFRERRLVVKSPSVNELTYPFEALIWNLMMLQVSIIDSMDQRFISVKK
jgi:hypothetical protein